MTRLGVRISEDNLEARIDRISPQTTVNDVLAALRAHDVGMGILHRAIADAVREVTRTGEPLRDVLVARGVRPRAPSLGLRRFRVPAELDEIPDLEYVTTAFGARRRASLARAAERIISWLVHPGTTLWTADVDFGEPGVDLVWSRNTNWQFACSFRVLTSKTPRNFIRAPHAASRR